MTRSLLRLAALAALAFLMTIAACGDDDGPSPSSRRAAVFVNTTYMDWDTTSWEAWDAGSNGYAAIVHAGFPVDTFSGLDAAAIHEALSGKDILFFPEIYDDPPFTAEAYDSIRAFVNDGGTVVVLSAGNDISTFNDMFGFSMTEDGNYSDRTPIPRMPDAGKTPFGAGPTSVPENDGTHYLLTADLPDSAIVAYGAPEGIDGAAVVVVPYGEGHIVFFGWSWADGKPKGYQDGGWNTLLSLTAGF